MIVHQKGGWTTMLELGRMRNRRGSRNSLLQGHLGLLLGRRFAIH